MEGYAGRGQTLHHALLRTSGQRTCDIKLERMAINGLRLASVSTMCSQNSNKPHLCTGSPTYVHPPKPFPVLGLHQEYCCLSCDLLFTSIFKCAQSCNWHPHWQPTVYHWQPTVYHWQPTVYHCHHVEYQFPLSPHMISNAAPVRRWHCYRTELTRLSVDVHNF